MDKKLINQVRVEQLQQIVDSRGKVMHMLRSDSPIFIQFGEIYFSMVNSGVIKAWKRHSAMTQHIAVPMGEIKLVLYDAREMSCTQGEINEFILGENNYLLIKIPPMIWYGFQGISSFPALIANCTDIPHCPEEIERIPPQDPVIPYIWK